MSGAMKSGMVPRSSSVVSHVRWVGALLKNKVTSCSRHK